MDKDIETMTTQDLERATDELLAADAAKSAPKKKSTRRTKAAEEKPVEKSQRVLQPPQTDGRPVHSLLAENKEEMGE